MLESPSLWSTPSHVPLSKSELKFSKIVSTGFRKNLTSLNGQGPTQLRFRSVDKQSLSSLPPLTSVGYLSHCHFTNFRTKDPSLKNSTVKRYDWDTGIDPDNSIDCFFNESCRGPCVIDDLFSDSITVTYPPINSWEISRRMELSETQRLTH